MAIIDVDRHILAQVVMIQTKIKLLSAKYSIEWARIIEVRDKTDALFSHPVRGTEDEFKKLRSKIYRASRNAEKLADEIAGMIYKQEALLMHLVSEIREVDTAKGKETL